MTRLRSPGVAILVGALVLVGATSAPAADAPPGPEDLGTPTQEQLEESVHAWDPADGEVFTWVVDPDTVHEWRITDDAVRELEETVVEGPKTTITLSADVLFPFASDVVPEAGVAKITELVVDAPQGAAVAVDGHTDSSGGDEINIDLSNRRALAVAAVLTTARPDLVVVATGHGSALPVAPEGGEDDDAARALNRRVEISYTS